LEFLAGFVDAVVEDTFVPLLHRTERTIQSFM